MNGIPAAIAAASVFADTLKAMQPYLLAIERYRLYRPAYLGLRVPYWQKKAAICRCLVASTAAHGAAQLHDIRTHREPAKGARVISLKAAQSKEPLLKDTKNVRIVK